MRQKPRLHKTFSWVCFMVVLGVVELLGLEVAPKTRSGYDASKAMLTWAGNAILEVEQSPKQASAALGRIQTYIDFYEKLSTSEVEQNVEHFADLQKLKDFEFEALYWLGVHKIQSKSWSETQLLQHLEVLRVRNSTSEYELVFLRELNMWNEYYKKKKEVLETFDAFPEKLNLEPPMPPTFPKIQGLSLRSLQDIVTIIDIAMKHHWNPGAEKLSQTLKAIAASCESKKAYRLAYETLEFMEKDLRSMSYQDKIHQLKKQQAASQKSDIGKALY